TLQAYWRNNKLAVTQDVGQNGITKARWYEFDTSGTPSLVQQGTIDPGPTVYTYKASIAINDNGDLGVTYLESSPTEFVSMYVTGQTNLDPAGTMQPPTLVQAGVDLFGSGGFGRLGDYSMVNVDPPDGTFLAANEYALPLGSTFPSFNWGTYIAQFHITPPVFLRGTVYDDTNGDGTLETGEPGLQGWNVYLDLNNNGKFDPGEPST